MNLAGAFLTVLCLIFLSLPYGMSRVSVKKVWVVGGIKGKWALPPPLLMGNFIFNPSLRIVPTTLTATSHYLLLSLSNHNHQSPSHPPTIISYL